MDINLYSPANPALEFIQCSKAEQADSGISELQRRATASMNGGVFYARNVAEPPITFLWGLLSGSRKACRFLCNGYSTPVSNPRPSSGIESGNKVLTKEPVTMAKRPLIRALGYIPAIPHIYTAPKSHPAPAVHSAF
jgi:hypothetical protein